ncbi:MAG: hypothetical protein LRZ84_14740 [Desertifilum sp.]|nr:hypothetical protein [Desertifilum sp.]
MKLPNPLYSWAWSVYHVQDKQREDVRAASGLILPLGSTPDPYFAHFSRLDDEGNPIYWLWLFDDIKEAVSLKLLPNYAPEVASLIEATLPKRNPNEPDRVFVQILPLEWIPQMRLAEFEISEVWVGFDYKRFAVTGSLMESTTRYEVAEFERLAAL